MMGPKLTVDGGAPPTYHSRKIVILEKNIWPYLNVCKILTF